MSDNPIGFVVAAVAMVACCLAIPLLAAVGGAGILAWVTGEGMAWLGLAAVAVLVVALYHRSRRRAEPPPVPAGAAREADSARLSSRVSDSVSGGKDQ
jgi:hypothetical protein